MPLDKEQVLNEYREAYAAAHPGDRVLEFIQKGGWYYFTTTSHVTSGSGPFRLKQFVEFAERLRRRAAEREA